MLIKIDRRRAQILPALTSLDIPRDISNDELHDLVRYTPAGKPRDILGTSTKIKMNGKLDQLSKVMYASPGREAGINLCPFAGACEAVCLGKTTGRLRMDQARRSRIMKAIWFHMFTDSFMERAVHEVRRHERYAIKKGLQPSIRMNGSTDIFWERHGLPQAVPSVQFYDYTKAPEKSRRERPSNYHLTFSLSEDPRSMRWALQYMEAGANAAAVFRMNGSNKQTDAKKATADLINAGDWQGFPLVSGDDTDVRYFDPPAHWVALYAKGKQALNDSSGFVQLIGGEAC